MTMNIAKNAIDLVGGTPMVWLDRIADGTSARIAGKLEFFNPTSSIKDRVGVAMLEAAERDGLIKEDTVIVEPSTGNTGVALAFACAARGYKLIVIMPDDAPEEKRRIVEAFGAKVVLTPAKDIMRGAVERAGEIVEKDSRHLMLQQFKNSANPDMHRRTTGEEIWNDTEGKVDFLVAGVGTGGTITGITEAIKPKKESFKAIAVEPADSPVLSGGDPGMHAIQGLGAGFIPDVLNMDIIDEVIPVKTIDAVKTSRLLASKEGLLTGISSGAAVWAAMNVANRKENRDKLIVVILPDTGERYLTTDLFS